MIVLGRGSCTEETRNSVGKIVFMSLAVGYKVPKVHRLIVFQYEAFGVTNMHPYVKHSNSKFSCSVQITQVLFSAVSTTHVRPGSAEWSFYFQRVTLSDTRHSLVPAKRTTCPIQLVLPSLVKSHDDVININF